MKDERKTKKQLISELDELRQRIAELDGADPERVQIEDALQESEERYRDLFENAPFAYFSVGSDGIIRMCNKRAGKMLGYTTEDLVGRSVSELYADTPHGKEKALQLFEKFRTGEVILDERLQMQHADGTPVWINLTVNAVHDAEGQIVESRSMVVDITEQILTEDSLREHTERLLRAQRVAKMGFLDWNLKTDEMIWSDQVYELFGIDKQRRKADIDLTLQLVHPDDIEFVNQNLELAITGEKKYDIDHRVLRTDGKVIWVQAHAELVRDESGNPVSLLGTIVDITERKQVEQELYQRTEDLKLINNINTAINRGESLPEIFQLLTEETKRVFDVQTTTVYLISEDQKHLEMQNISLVPGVAKRIEKLIGTRIPDIRIPLKGGGLSQKSLLADGPRLANDSETIQEWLLEFAQTTYISEKLRRVIRKLISQIYEIVGVRSLITVPLVSAGEPIGLMDFARDVSFTEEDTKRVAFVAGQLTSAITRLQAEEALRESESKFRSFVESTANIVFTINRDGEILYMNHAPEGVELDQIIGTSMYTHMDSDFHGVVKEHVRAVFDEKKPDQYETRGNGPHGEQSNYLSNIGPVFGDDGEVISAIISTQDITRRKQAEHALVDSEYLLRESQKVARLGSYILDIPSGIWESSSILDDVFGIDKEYIKDVQAWLQIVAPEDQAMMQDYFAINVLTDHESFNKEYRIQRIDDQQERWVHGMGELEFNDAGKPVKMIGTIQDITERKASEQALTESEIRYRSLFENMLNGFIYCKLILDKDGEVADVEILEVNKVFETITGISREQVTGMKLSEVVPGLRQANPALFDKYAKAVLEGESIEFEEYIAPLDQWVHVMVFRPEEGYAVAVFEDISMRKRAEEEIRLNAERLATLHEIDQAILAAQSTNEIAQSAIVQLKNLISAYRISIVLFEPDDKINILSVAPVDEETKVFSGTRLSSDQVAIRDPLWQGEVYVVNDIEALSHPSPVDLKILKEGVKSYVNIPLMVQEELIGTLNIGADRTGEFHADQMEIAREVADSLAIALQQNRLFEQVRVGRDRLQLLSRKLVNVQEAERRHIAQELHDEIGQLLTGLKLTIQMTKELQSEEGKKEFEEADELLEALLRQVRDLSLDLRPSMLDDLGLLPTLLWQIERFEGQTGIKVGFEHSGLTSERFSPEIETTAYRIIQEALTNVARHADTGEVAVKVTFAKNTLEIRVSDEGTGFDVSRQAEMETSLGLIGMQERAIMLGGSFEIESEVGKGTIITADLPLEGRLERRSGERGT